MHHARQAFHDRLHGGLQARQTGPARPGAVQMPVDLLPDLADLLAQLARQRGALDRLVIGQVGQHRQRRLDRVRGLPASWRARDHLLVLVQHAVEALRQRLDLARIGALQALRAPSRTAFRLACSVRRA